MTAPSVSRARPRGRALRTQPFRILVASNGEPEALGAIRIATLVARRRSAAVHALIVAGPYMQTLPSVFAVAPAIFVDGESRRASLESLRRQLGAVRGTREWTMRVTTGSAAESIHDVAARWPASVVIMGMGKHSFADRLIGSETAVKVAAHATVPILAVPAEVHALPTRAVAAVDFSESSIAAARFAATLLGPNGRLTLLYASPLIAKKGQSGTLTDLYTTGAREQLAEIASDIHRRSKRPVEFAVAAGSIVEALMEFVEASTCDLIALGAHEPGLIERLLVGRVRSSVIRSASCSVLVVPAADTD
jgi:nucleotide-binding universal stress UspA family protein